jgi:hypothetical protein
MSRIRYDHPPEAKRLRKHGRIAIWNRAMIIFVIVVAIVWVTDIALLVDGKYFLQIMGESLVSMVISQVSYGLTFQFDCFGPVRLT